MNQVQELNEAKIIAGGKDAGVLKRFMQEFFPYTEFKKIGLFTKEMRGDYYSQAQKVCHYFGFTSVFEYGSRQINCHITYVEGFRPENEGFISTIKSIYE